MAVCLVSLLLCDGLETWLGVFHISHWRKTPARKPARISMYRQKEGQMDWWINIQGIPSAIACLICWPVKEPGATLFHTEKVWCKGKGVFLHIGFKNQFLCLPFFINHGYKRSSAFMFTLNPWYLWGLRATTICEYLKTANTWGSFWKKCIFSNTKQTVTCINTHNGPRSVN